MIVQAIKTEKITAGAMDLSALLDTYLTDLQEDSILAITSKVVSLCENNVAPIAGTNKEDLVIGESDYYLPNDLGKYGYRFTLIRNTLISAAGIDKSNADNQYVLWPKDPQQTANQVRTYLRRRFGLERVGVLITDSVCHPLRRGAMGITLAHSGFAALKDYVGKPDLFGRPFHASKADIAGGLTAAAVVQMGEGSEQTPLAVLSDLPFVEFQDRDPSPEELAEINVPLEDDLFAPFLLSADWQKGRRTS